ncbi:Protein-tyrosine sulfotransferase 2 [Lamellibrachia satsuma]|nr:Protein-tyrosine sulfotransferase 2 [Lamellibrachia satsuma]
MAIQRLTRQVLLVIAVVIILAFYHSFLQPCGHDPKYKMVPKDPVQYVYDSQNRNFPYDKSMPLIFIGGVPRSGTTLMRAMLDAHPMVRCGEETRVIPRILGMRGQWAKSPKESKRLEEAGLSNEVIDSAIAAFILEVIAKHGEPAPRLCNKDPFTLKSSLYLSQMFPNSKFLLLIRDGRAVVHSIISRKVTISGFNLKSYRNCLQKWNQAIETMYYQCVHLGRHRCMPIYYEQLVLQPEATMHAILEFLDVPWNDVVLHHEMYINKPGGVSLSKVERSTDQVIKPVNLDALTKWVDAIPHDVKQDMSSIAPMLAKLGYDPYAYPPHYGDASQFVSDNTHEIRANEDYWRQRTRAIQRGNKPQRTYSFHAKGGINSSIVDVPSRSVGGEHVVAGTGVKTEKTIDILGAEDKAGFSNGNNDDADR